MKICGWVFIVIGSVALLGCFVGVGSAFGPLFWLGFGLYLVHRANQKKQEQADKDKWSNGIE